MIVAYKPRWVWVDRAAIIETYYDRVAEARDPDNTPHYTYRTCLVRSKGQWWVSGVDIRDPKQDIGPYPTLNDAICAAEVMIELDEIPWSKR